MVFIINKIKMCTILYDDHLQSTFFRVSSKGNKRTFKDRDVKIKKYHKQPNLDQTQLKQITIWKHENVSF